MLSYLEDKIDTLELTESHSPSKNTFEEIVDAAIATPEINQVPVSIHKLHQMELVWISSIKNLMKLV